MVDGPAAQVASLADVSSLGHRRCPGHAAVVDTDGPPIFVCQLGNTTLLNRAGGGPMVIMLNPATTAVLGNPADPSRVPLL
jgi:hypothetical protein